MMLNSAAIQELLRQVVQKFGVPHISVSFTLQGGTLSISAGKRASEHELRYDLACIRKLLTSLVALHLVAQDALSLDEPVATYLPELQGVPRATSLRLWHLLSNTSGYGTMGLRNEGWSASSTLTKLLEFVRCCPQIFTPGTVFSYQLDDYRLVAEIIRRVTGQEISVLIRQLILQPLGVDADTGQDAPRYRFDVPSRTFQALCLDETSSATDDGLPMESLTIEGLGAIAASLAGALPAARQQPACLTAAQWVLSRKTSIPFAPESPLSAHMFFAYGLGCGEYPDGTLGHGGMSDGQCCALRFDPRRQLALAITISANVPHVRDMLLSAILRLCGNPPGGREPPQRPRTFQADELTGRYFSGDHAACVEIQRRGAELICRIPSAATAQDAGRPDCAPAQVTFLMENGTPVLHPSSRQFAGVFFREPNSNTPCLMLGNRAYKHWCAD
jgi:CubicO group peptidase (beta-lactamase class C family)